MSDKVLKFIQIVNSQFNKRHASPADEQTWLVSMIQGLRGYDASVLQRAAQKIIMTRRDPGFPYLAQCRDACDDIIKIERAEKAPKFDDAAKEKARYQSADWQAQEADRLIKIGPLGKRAALEGWALSLHDFIRLNARLPTQDFEINKCIAAAKGFDEAYESVLNGNGGVCAEALERLGDTMRAKRRRIESEILGVDR